jgi:hypothetical protein
MKKEFVFRYYFARGYTSLKFRANSREEADIKLLEYFRALYPSADPALRAKPERVTKHDNIKKEKKP